jgi:hypothetical protein
MSIWTDIFSTRKFNAQFFTFTEGDRVKFHIDFDSGHLGALKALYNCGTLRTVVTRNAQAMANGKWWIVRGNEMENPEILKSYPAISELLENPNPEQDWSELIIQAEIFRQVYGSVFFYASTPEGFGNDAAYRLWAIPPDEVAFSGEMAIITTDGETITVPRDRLCEVRDTGKFVKPIIRERSQVLDTHHSRVYSARDAIKNIIQAEEAIYSINRDRGALGFLSLEDKDATIRAALPPAEKESLLAQLRETYGITRNKSKIMVINAAMKWQQMSMSVKDLMLIEGMDKNMETLCNVFDYPKDLLVSDAKYSNKQVSKGHYEEAVIPFSQIYAGKLGRFLGLRPGDNFVIDFSHVPAMKEAEEQKAKVYYQKATAVVKLYEDGVLSREEARLEMGYEMEIEGKTMYNQNNNSDGGTDGGANQSVEE